MIETLLQENLTGINEEGKDPNSPLQYLTVTSVIGDVVENKKGENLGKIKDIMLNVNTGIIDYYVIDYGGFIGIGDKYFAVPAQHLTVEPTKKIFIWEQEKSVLDNAPGFDKEHWPETNMHYYTTDNYWHFMD